MAVAAIIAVIRKLSRDAAIPYHDQLVRPWPAIRRAEQQVGYDEGYMDGSGGNPKRTTRAMSQLVLVHPSPCA